jgi:hypothetical protein
LSIAFHAYRKWNSIEPFPIARPAHHLHEANRLRAEMASEKRGSLEGVSLRNAYGTNDAQRFVGQDGQDGQRYRSTRGNASDMRFVGSSGDDGASHSASHAPALREKAAAFHAAVAQFAAACIHIREPPVHALDARCA